MGLRLDGARSAENPTVALQDALVWWKALPLSIARWFPGAYTVLGTDGYGLSESRDSLRGYFEVSRDWVVFAALSTLARANKGAVADALAYASAAGLDLDKAAPS